MLIEINALDTLFFRDGKPFNMGENHWTDSIFPPNMSTIYGAIRTAYFTQNMTIFEELRDNNNLNTEKDPTKKLVIKKLLYKIGPKGKEVYYYPSALDLVELKDKPREVLDDELRKGRYSVCPLKLKKNQGINSLGNLEYVLYFDKHVKGISDGLIDEASLNDYINEELDDIKIRKIADCLIDEPKVGIGIDKKLRTSKDSRLYRIDLKRVKDFSILVEIEGIELQDAGVFKLGGEGKYARYRQIKNNLLDLKNNIEIDKKFKVTLTTPALFENGWIPRNVCEDQYIMKNAKFEIKLIAAAVGKHSPVGGFDIAKNRPKPMLKSVPSGSTYYFKIIKGSSMDILEHFHWKAISDRKVEEGYGIGFVAKWEG